MFLRSMFEWLDINLPGSVSLRESTSAFAYLLTAHVLSICLFAGLIIMMDLRLAGIGNRRTSFSELQKTLFPWQMAGMALAALTGFLLFYQDVRPSRGSHLYVHRSPQGHAGGRGSRGSYLVQGRRARFDRALGERSGERTVDHVDLSRNQTRRKKGPLGPLAILIFRRGLKLYTRSVQRIAQTFAAADALAGR